MTDREVLLTVQLTASDQGDNAAQGQLDVNAIGYVSNVYVLPGEQQDASGRTQYAGWVDIAPDEATEIHNALHGKD